MSTRQFLGKVAAAARNLAADAIFPPRCTGCGRFEASVFCQGCLAAAVELAHGPGAHLCPVCSAPLAPGALESAPCPNCRSNRYHPAPPYSAARSAYLYEGPVRHAIHGLKYRGKTSYAPRLAHKLAATLREDPVLSATPLELVTAVPLHPWRQWRRGYNQSELLARALASQCGLPYHRLLQRARFTPPQVGLTRTERAANMREVFAMATPEPQTRDLVAGKHVLLIDDVLTTGATVSAAAAVLCGAGAAGVCVLTLAREP